ncbi:Hypothetical predicted protein [Paramuricea clavata]|uniref:Uncharacterized protein n=1 Tax=Paramuricea clavata TaxID=317549 RepID=A0A6S7IFA1_PARCT|nr:Hypothetical predicted protein [Paramuricea clavata]
MLNYPPLNDNVAVISENDTPVAVSVEEVLSHLQRIGSGKSSDPDNLPNWVLKSFADLLAEPVTVILNASLAFREERLYPRCGRSQSIWFHSWLLYYIGRNILNSSLDRNCGCEGRNRTSAAYGLSEGI